MAWILIALLILGLSAVVGRLVRSPVEQDFGPASPEDIQLPESQWLLEVPLEEVGATLFLLQRRIHEISEDDAERLALRIRELPPGRKATYHFPVVGEVLAITVSKTYENTGRILFQSSNETITTVRRVFGR